MMGVRLTPVQQPPGVMSQMISWALPILTLLMGLIVDAVPLATGVWAAAIPSFFLPILFYWSVHAPARVPLLFVCAMGFAADMIHSVPLGVHALSYMIVTLGAKSQSEQLSSLGLLFNWALFALAMISFGALKLILSMIGTVGIFENSLVPAALQALQLVLTTIAAYVAFHLVLSGLRRLFFPVKPNET